jgi:predicted PP-loop superfamily ATPase
MAARCGDEKRCHGDMRETVCGAVEIQNAAVVMDGDGERRLATMSDGGEDEISFSVPGALCFEKKEEKLPVL